MIRLLELLKEVIQEAKRPTTTAAVRDLLQSTDRVARHSDGKRVKNINSVTKDEFKAIISNSLDIDLGKITVIPAPNEESGTFDIYSFPYNGGQAGIVLAGKQRGEEGEIAQKSSLQLQLQAAIQQSQRKDGDIVIQAGGKEYFIAKGEVIKEAGTPMADISIDNKIFIQHKQAKFQQLSGFIKTRISEYISPAAKIEMDNFVKEVKARVGNVMPPKTGIKKKVVDLNLSKAALFGSAAGFGRDMVQLICQGEIKLVEVKDKIDTYVIQGSTPAETLDYTTTTIPTKWHPYMIARYSSTSGHNQFGIKNCRFNFTPESFYSGAEVIPPPDKKDKEKVG